MSWYYRYGWLQGRWPQSAVAKISAVTLAPAALRARLLRSAMDSLRADFLKSTPFEADVWSGSALPTQGCWQRCSPCQLHR